MHRQGIEVSPELKRWNRFRLRVPGSLSDGAPVWAICLVAYRSYPFAGSAHLVAQKDRAPLSQRAGCGFESRPGLPARSGAAVAPDRAEPPFMPSAGRRRVRGGDGTEATAFWRWRATFNFQVRRFSGPWSSSESFDRKLCEAVRLRRVLEQASGVSAILGLTALRNGFQDLRRQFRDLRDD